MKRTAVIITLGVILLAGGYLAYEKWYNNAPTTLWDNVPGNAVLVFESKHTVNSWNKLNNTPLWNSLQHISSFNAIKRDLELLDSIDGKSGSIASLLQDNSLISMHVTGKNTFDWIYYVDMSTESSQRIASRILNHFKDSPNAQFSERVYQDLKLSELTAKGDTFTYYLDDNVLVGSFTSFLVEDVVRLVNDDFKTSFKRANHLLFELPQLANDDGNIYLNIEMASLWLSSFVRSDLRQDIKKIRDFGQSGFFDIAIANDKILLNGFTLSTSQNDFLSTLQSQQPVKTDIKYIVPNRAAVLYEFSLSQAMTWHDELIRYWKQSEQEFLSTRKHFENEYSFPFSELYEWMGKSVGLVKLQSSYKAGNEHLVYIHTKDVNEALNQLNTFSESLAQAHGDSVYVERFSSYALRELKVKDFPKLALGPFFSGFDVSYFTAIGDYIVIGNSMLALKSLIEDIENENTWGRSVAFNSFLDNNLEESNFSLTFNTRKIWDDLLSDMNPRWRKFAQEHADQIKSFKMGSLQFSKLDENFYTSIAIQYEEQMQVDKQQSYEALQQTVLEHKIITKPFVVKNHNTRQLEVALQDSALNFVLIGENGDVLLKDSIGSPIVSDIEQIDYYKNGKLQFFFATPSALHIIDRLGNYIEDYPISIDQTMRYATVVDYDKSKNYRFLLADERGNLYLYNKKGVNLEGWMPRELTGRLSSKPFHLRVRGKDCIVAIQQNGVVNIMNRRGKMMPGFPLKLNTRINTNPFINIGSDFSKTVFTVLTYDGRLMHFNLEGTIISSEQLYKPAKETTFKLIPDALGKNYIIARQDLGRLVLLTADNEEILAKDYLSSNDLAVQYYDFSSDHKLYAITDITQGFTYIYNKDGKLINATPINSEHSIGLIYFEADQQYHVYVTYQDTFRLLEF